VVDTAQAGNWSDGTTWVGGVVPGDGDQATILHDHVMDVSFIIGDGSTTVDQLRIEAPTATAEDITITLKGRGSSNQYWDIAPGVTLNFDAATDGRWSQEANAPTYAAIRFNGTAAKPITVTSIGAGALYWYMSGSPSVGAGRVEARYTYFSSCGSEANPLFRWYQKGCPVEYGFILDHCTFDACYTIEDYFANESGNQTTGNVGTVDIGYCKWTNPPTVDPIPDGGNWGHLIVMGYGGMDVKVHHCDFPDGFRIFFCRSIDVSFTDNVLRETVTVRRDVGTGNNWTQGVMKEVSRNLVMLGGAGFPMMYGEQCKNNLFLSNNSNTHFGDVAGGTGVLEMHGNIFASTNISSTSEGDGRFPRSAESGAQADNYIDFTDCITLPTRNGYGNRSMTATLFTGLYNSVSNVHVEARHNTCYVGYLGGINVSENSDSASGLIGHTKGNIFVGPSSGGVHKIADLGGDTLPVADDVFLPADVGNNAGFRLALGGQSPGKGYDGDSRTFTFSGAGPHNVGVGDVDDVDPQYVDTLRQPWLWVDPTHTHITGVTALCDRLSLGAQGYTILDVLEWLRNGYRPQAEEYRGAGHADDGARDLGAVTMAPAFTPQFEFSLAWSEFTHYPGLPPDMGAFITAIQANGSITANLVSTEPEVVGSTVRLVFDVQLDAAQQALVINEANVLGAPV
jgi:hypothetical protein